MGKNIKYAIIGILVTVVVIIVAISLYFGLKGTDDETNQPVDNNKHEIKNETSDGKDYFEHGAVATDAKQCSEIGRDVLKEGGHAVDAAIASLICTGVVNLHSTGIGGGGFMTLYDKSKKKAVVYDYREVGFSTLTATTYNNDSSLKIRYGLAVGIPGELRGLKLAHDKYGKLPWKRLIQPSIELAKTGTRIGKHMYANMKSSSTKKYIENDPGLHELLFNEDGTMKKEGDTVVNEKYAKTLGKVADDADVLYKGELGQSFVDDVNNNNGNMTLEELKSYTVKQKEPLKMKLGEKLTLYTTPLPGGGSVLIRILNILKGYKWTKEDIETFDKKLLNYHRMVEAFKFSYAYRPHLGDPDVVADNYTATLTQAAKDVINETLAEMIRGKINDTHTQQNEYYDEFFSTTNDHGTTHVSVLDKDGNAVSATDTINYAFGAKFRSMTSGIIFNNEMGDFFTPSSFGKEYPIPVANAPAPGKRPLSSTCPSVIVDEKGDVVMVIGGSGGTRITLSTAWVIMKKLWFDYNLSDAVEDVRVQHAFSPSYIRSETMEGYGLSDELRKGLESKGHVVKNSRYNAIVQAIFVDGDKIYAKSDLRKEGVAAGY